MSLMVPTNPEVLQAAQVIQAMAAEAGFVINIQATEFASSLQLATNGEFEAYLIGWSGRTDPDGNIYNFVACTAPPALNSPHYCNADVDSELDAARTAAAPAERIAHYVLLVVPSTLVPIAAAPDRNVLINHRHAGAIGIRIVDVVSFTLDPRLFAP